MSASALLRMMRAAHLQDAREREPCTCPGPHQPGASYCRRGRAEHEAIETAEQDYRDHYDLTRANR